MALRRCTAFAAALSALRPSAQRQLGRRAQAGPDVSAALEPCAAALSDAAVAAVARDAAPGTLFIVPVPLGESSDMSLRCAAALLASDVIACEDTRKTGKLLELMAAPRTGPAPVKLVRHDEHTWQRAVPALLDQLAGGAVVALVSDAGTPAVSDPGAELVAAAAAAGVRVVALPGPCAAATAVSASGQRLTAGWAFRGFPPPSGGARKAFFERLGGDAAVLYEAPHRVRKTLSDLSGAGHGKRPLAAARELTKPHEECYRGTVDDALAWLDGGGGGARPSSGGEGKKQKKATPPVPRGEFTLVLGDNDDDGARGGADEAGVAAESRARAAGVRAAVAALKEDGMSTKDAVRAATAALRATRKSDVYGIANEVGPGS